MSTSKLDLDQNIKFAPRSTRPAPACAAPARGPPWPCHSLYCLFANKPRGYGGKSNTFLCKESHFHLLLLSFPAPLWKCLLLSTCLESHSRNSRMIIPTPYQSLILPVPRGRDLLLGVPTNKATWLLTPRHPGY